MLTKPSSPYFSSGPCKKRPNYSLNNLRTDLLGRSHRSSLGKSALREAIDLSKEILQVPNDYLLGIVPASDTGAVEMALWSLLGERPVDICFWESFGQGWMTDITKQLQLKNVRLFSADYGELPDFSEVNSDYDIVFTWNGTTSGVKVPNVDWISSQRKGLSICDATSAVFAMPLDWEKLDVVTYSWQKVLGGEGAHGVLILSPRAVNRLESYTPAWPLPKIFRMTKSGNLIKGIFEGMTINTPSMLAVADYLDVLHWVKSIGGLEETIKRSDENLKVIEDFVSANHWIDFLARKKETRSNTSVCLKIDLSADKIKEMLFFLSSQEVAYDIGAYRDAPVGLRIWTGATVEKTDLQLLMPWIEEAYKQVK